MENGKFFTILGWVATATAMAMYVSYISANQQQPQRAKRRLATAFGGGYQLYFVGGLRTSEKAQTRFASSDCQFPRDYFWYHNLFDGFIICKTLSINNLTTRFFYFL